MKRIHIVIIAASALALSACRPSSIEVPSPPSTQTASPNKSENMSDSPSSTGAVIEDAEMPMFIDISEAQIDERALTYLGDIDDAMYDMQPLLLTAVDAVNAFNEPLYAQGAPSIDTSWHMVYNLITDFSLDDTRINQDEYPVKVPEDMVQQFFTNAFFAYDGQVPPPPEGMDGLIQAAPGGYTFEIADGEGEYEYAVASIKIVPVENSQMPPQLISQIGLDSQEDCVEVCMLVSPVYDEDAEANQYLIYLEPNEKSDYNYSVLNIVSFDIKDNPPTELAAYSNLRFGFSITYPAYFRNLGESDNGDGSTFEATDGTRFAVWGSHNIFNRDAVSYLDEIKKDKNIIAQGAYSENAVVIYFEGEASDSNMVVHFAHMADEFEDGAIYAFEFTCSPSSLESYQDAINLLATNFSDMNIPTDVWGAAFDAINS